MRASASRRTGPPGDDPATRTGERPSAACIEAFEANVAQLYRTLRRYGVRPADLDDVIQDVFVAMWRSWGEFDQQRPVRPWLAGIAFRVSRNHLRRKWREIPDPALDAPDEAIFGDDRLVASEARALVMQALGRLPEKYRVPFVMHEIDEVPVNEVASLLALPRATTYTRLRRARIAFARHVEDLQARGSASLLIPAITPAQLLRLERTPPPVPPAARASAEAFARASVEAFARTRVLGAPARLVPRPTPLRWLAPALGLAVVGAGVWLARPVAAPVAAVAAPGPMTAPAASPTPAPIRAAAIPAPPPLPSFTPAFAPAPAPAPARDQAGPAGWWSFDEPGRLAQDASGHRRDCLLHEALPVRFVSGPRGSAIDLGAGGWLECPLPEIATGKPIAMSMAAWIEVRALRQVDTAIATRQIETSFRDLFFFGFSHDRLTVRSHAWTGLAQARVPGLIGRWAHVAFTHDEAGETILYVDGAEVARAAGAPAAWGHVRSPLTLGAGQYGRNPQNVRQRFDGAIDDVRLYDRALTPGEIETLALGPTALAR